MTGLCFPPASLMNVHVYLKNKCNPERLYSELSIDDFIISLKPKGAGLDIILKLGLEFRTIRLFKNCINIISCKNLDEAAEMLYVMLCSVSEGDWTKQTEEWQRYARIWCDEYHRVKGQERTR